jgi:hypothetical protein
MISGERSEAMSVWWVSVDLNLDLEDGFFAEVRNAMGFLVEVRVMVAMEATEITLLGRGFSGDTLVCWAVGAVGFFDDSLVCGRLESVATSVVGSRVTVPCRTAWIELS